MISSFDHFRIVREWWGSRIVQSDTAALKINPSTQQGAFECLILGVLYAINGTGPDIQDTFNALRNGGYTNIELLARISPASEEFDRIHQIFKSNYFNGRLALYVTTQGLPGGKVMQIIENARDIVADRQLSGDLSKVSSLYSDDGYSTLKWLWARPGIRKKAFWMMREMRMRGAWNIDGKYCCVPDEQVGSSLKRWNKIAWWPAAGNPSFDLCLECSDIVWNYFGGLYDLPILHYARDYRCNSKGFRMCTNCKIFPHCSP